MRIGWIAIVGLLTLGCSKTKTASAWTIEGEWIALPEASSSGANEAMWRGARVQFKPDGSFREFGGLELAGTYTVEGDNVHLKFTKFLGKDTYFISAKMAPVKSVGGNDLPKSMDLHVQPNGNIKLSKFGPIDAPVTFVQSPPSSIEQDVRTFAHLPDDQMESEGDRLWAKIADRKSEGVQPLIDLLKDKDPEVHYWSIVFLGHTKDRRAVSPLLDELGANGKRYPTAATSALGELGYPDAVDGLIKVLKKHQVNNYTISQALVKIGDKRAVQPLIESMMASKRPEYVIRALGKLGDPKALPALRKLKSSNSEPVVIALAEAITRLDPKDPFPKGKVPLLLKLSSGGDWMQQDDAMHALLAIGDPRAKPLFLDLLRNPQFVIRRDAIDALVKLRAKDAIPAIKGMLMDDNDQIREAAQRAIRVLSQ
jgi:HEAT repeat protein